MYQKNQVLGRSNKSSNNIQMCDFKLSARKRQSFANCTTVWSLTSVIYRALLQNHPLVKTINCTL